MAHERFVFEDHSGRGVDGAERNRTEYFVYMYFVLNTTSGYPHTGIVATTRIALECWCVRDHLNIHQFCLVRSSCRSRLQPSDIALLSRKSTCTYTPVRVVTTVNKVTREEISLNKLGGLHSDFFQLFLQGVRVVQTPFILICLLTC